MPNDVGLLRAAEKFFEIETSSNRKILLCFKTTTFVSYTMHSHTNYIVYTYNIYEKCN
jgi:hypothetical protein